MSQFLRVKVTALTEESVVCQLPSGQQFIFPYTAAERAANHFSIQLGDEVIMSLTRSRDILNEIIKDTQHQIVDAPQTPQNNSSRAAGTI